MTSGGVPILVTGMHRSGTTWVGKMLAAAPGVGYIDEPLCLGNDRGVLDVDVRRWYPYIDDENAEDYVEAFRQTLAFRYATHAALGDVRFLRDLGRVGKHFSEVTFKRLLRSRPLLKDPFAVFSIPFFATQLNCRIVVTVRHPAAVVGSLKRLGWRFDVHDLLSQPLLVRRHLEPYRADLQYALSRPRDVVLQGSVLWRSIYGTVRSLSESDPATFMLVRHEDIAEDPLGSFSRLYESLGLDLTQTAREMILRSSSTENRKESFLGRPTTSISLDSRAQLTTWQNRLSEAEISRIHEIVAEVGDHYYDDSFWHPCTPRQPRR